jgi:hypothetical protein
MIASGTAYLPVLGVIFLAVICGIGLLLVWVAELSALAPFFERFSGVVAPFAAVLALLFGLFIVFLSGDVVNQRNRAEAAVAREADAILVLRGIAAALGERGQPLAGLTVDYAKAAAADDWRSIAGGQAGERLSRSVLQECLFGEMAQAAPQVQRSAVDAAMDIRTSRRERLSVAGSQTAWHKWLAVLVLGVLTQIAVMIVHVGKPRASAFATVLFSAAMAFVLWTTLVRLDPFSGASPVSLQPIAAASRSPL